MMDLKKLKITVVGCGWLGLPLCEALSAVGHEITTTTTTRPKQLSLSKKFNIRLFDVTKDIPDQNLLASEIIIYTVPPIGHQEVESFFHIVNPDQKIIFISSTSVYGKSDGLIDENSEQNPQSKNGKILKQSEVYLRNHFQNLTIIRPGGLYSEDRHPIYSLQGKTGLTTGDELLHLVHRDDVIEAIKKIIENQLWAEDFNLVNDLRVKKEVYYTEKAKTLELELPQYISSENENPTNITNNKSKKYLSLLYKE